MTEEHNGTHDATGSSGTNTTRRTVLKAAGAGTAGLAVGGASLGTSSAAGIETPHLTRCGNELRDPSGNKVLLHGVNLVDPCRSSRGWRGATITEMIDMATSGDWSNTRVLRLPMQPQDISAADDRSGLSDDSNTSQMNHGDNWGPMLPGKFDQSELDAYLEKFVDPAVDAAGQAGVYIQLDYHRHFPIFHQPQYGSDHGFSNCNNDSFENDMGMCGERGTLWHGADQVSELEGLEGTQSDAYFEPQDHCEALDDELMMFWSTVANRYAGNEYSHVLLDIFNEPTGPYAGDWGTNTKVPEGGGEDAGINPDAAGPQAKPYWRLFLERSAPWIQAAHENAPDKVMTIGSPRWSQYTYWAKEMQVNDVDNSIPDVTDKMCYTGHRYTHENVSPLSKYYGEPAEEVPMFFNEWGWAVGGGSNEFEFIDGSTEEYPSGVNRGSDWVPTSEKANQAAEYNEFFQNYPVHSVAWCFDHTWSPSFFAGESFDELTPYSDTHARWWQGWLANNQTGQPPQATSGSFTCDDNTTPQGPTWPEGATDPDNDGHYEDLTGNGEIDNQDVVTYFQNMGTSNSASPMAQNGNLQYYDYTGNSQIDYQDLISLFGEIA